MTHEEAKARVEEEFRIVHKIGLAGGSADIKSAMLNVEALVTSAENKGREEGLKAKGVFWTETNRADVIGHPCGHWVSSVMSFCTVCREKEQAKQDGWNQAIEESMKVAKKEIILPCTCTPTLADPSPDCSCGSLMNYEMRQEIASQLEKLKRN